MAILRPWTAGNRTAYDRVTDFATLPADAGRRRNPIYFIATDDALAAYDIPCGRCGELVKDDGGERGNRGIYHPRTKRLELHHYLCAWENILGAGGLLEEILNRRDR